MFRRRTLIALSIQILTCMILPIAASATVNLNTGAMYQPALPKASNFSCYQNKIASQDKLSAVAMTNFLDCLVGMPRLSRLAAQWIVLKKAHWILADNDSKKWKASFARNPYDPKQSHVLSTAFRKIKHQKREKFLRFLKSLENDTFPRFINGDNNPGWANKTAWSFAATVNHYTAYHDTPLPPWVAKHRQEGSKKSYKGTLLESENYPDGWYQKYFTGTQYTKRYGNEEKTYSYNHQRAFQVLPLSIYGDAYWPQLRELYYKFDEYEESKCLHRQERKVFQAMFTTLEHPHLAEAMHLGVIKGFGPSAEDESLPEGYPVNSSWSLPQIVGAYGPRGPYERFTDPVTGETIDGLGRPSQVNASGDMIIGFSWVGQVLDGSDTSYTSERFDESFNYAAYGPHGIIGRKIYISGVNKSQMRFKGDVNGRPVSAFQGQNAIIRDITPEAVEALRELGGLGSALDRLIHTRFQGKMVKSNFGVAANYSNASEVVDDLKGASQISADYGQQRRDGTLTSSHPALTNRFFTDTVISKGLPLSRWVWLMSKLQPNMNYHLMSWNYVLMQRPPTITPPYKSYFNRLVKTIDKGNSFFPPFQF